MDLFSIKSSAAIFSNVKSLKNLRQTINGKCESMDYERGLKQLKQRLRGTKWESDFLIYEARLRENLRREQLYGPTPELKADRAEITHHLNDLTPPIKISFTDLCADTAQTSKQSWMTITLVISMLLNLLFASTTFYLFNRTVKSPSANNPTNTPAVSTATTVVQPAQTAVTLTSSPTPGATTASTPSDTRTISLNKTLTCTAYCGSVHITIKTATINSGQFTLNLSIDPGIAQGNYYFGNLDIQAPDGTTYQPQGQLRDTSRFDLVPHQPITLVATYPFIPQSGSLYTLKTTLWSETPGTAEELFGDYQFKV